jgi:hypothetical protein
MCYEVLDVSFWHLSARERLWQGFLELLARSKRENCGVFAPSQQILGYIFTLDNQFCKGSVRPSCKGSFPTHPDPCVESTVT